ncbi:MAG TPA: hypothetical protein VKS78_17240, partial [Roseiarcus sp.]|nr:hypothetical protein [Roseiarcus sp.]
LEDLKEKKVQIYTSSIVFAEVLPSALKKPEIGSFQAFLKDFEGMINVIDATPNVMQLAGLLKDLPYKKIVGKDAKDGPIIATRRLSTGDAIMLATCAHLIEAFKVKVDAFHTYDQGKKRDPVEGKMVPIISYETWCDKFSPEQFAVASRVTGFKRKQPTHPMPRLEFPPSSESTSPAASTPSTPSAPQDQPPTK